MNYKPCYLNYARPAQGESVQSCPTGLSVFQSIDGRNRAAQTWGTGWSGDSEIEDHQYERLWSSDADCFANAITNLYKGQLTRGRIKVHSLKNSRNLYKKMNLVVAQVPCKEPSPTDTLLTSSTASWKLQGQLTFSLNTLYNLVVKNSTWLSSVLTSSIFNT